MPHYILKKGIGQGTPLTLSSQGRATNWISNMFGKDDRIFKGMTRHKSALGYPGIFIGGHGSENDWLFANFLADKDGQSIVELAAESEPVVVEQQAQVAVP